MSKRMNSLPSCSASCFASSVLPTPVGPVNRKQPERTLGRSESGARTLDRLGDQVHGLVLAEHDALERFFERPQPFAIGGRRLARGDARHPRGDRLDIGRVDRQRVGR